MARTGNYATENLAGESYKAFLPPPLPPDPPLRIDSKLQIKIDLANQALGRLDAVTELLPDTEFLVYSYVRKEAVLSSQIEGTVSSLSDLLLFEADEAPGVPIEDVTESVNYLAAIKHGIARIQTGELPLCNRLLREMHNLLLQSGRGAGKTPGRFRREQNWLGGASPAAARYVPPPWPEVEPMMASLEKFLHDEKVGPTPLLLKAAMAHAQFETIHPFLDGNGRIGRLLITLLLVTSRVLRQPTLYLSLFFKQNRDAYYDCLQAIRLEGAWEAWIDFFMTGVREVAESAVQTSRRLNAILVEDRRQTESMGRASATASRLHGLASQRIVLRPADAVTELGLSEPAVYQAFKRLDEIGILTEVTGRRRGRLYAYERYLAVLNEGT